MSRFCMIFTIKITNCQRDASWKLMSMCNTFCTAHVHLFACVWLHRFLSEILGNKRRCACRRSDQRRKMFQRKKEKTKICPRMFSRLSSPLRRRKSWHAILLSHDVTSASSIMHECIFIGKYLVIHSDIWKLFCNSVVNVGRFAFKWIHLLFSRLQRLKFAVWQYLLFKLSLECLLWRTQHRPGLF